MANTSATGGPLAPNPSPAPPYPAPPLEGQALLRFFNVLMSGITGLPGSMVRPYWQGSPPNIPDQGNAWMAFKITSRPSDEYPFVGRLNYLPEAGMDNLQRHETLEIGTEFYDLGSTGVNDSGGFADSYAALLRDGLAIPQNREPLFLSGMGLVKVGACVTVPEKFKQRWQYRVDFEFTVRRQIDRNYPVLTIESASGTINYDTGLPPQTFSAT